MKPPQSDAAKRALGLWKQSARSARLHTVIRWWTAPFEALETEVPRSGKILEVGCGHGMFATFLALSSEDRTVVGVDIDAQKIELAQESVRSLRPGEATISFEHRPSGEILTIEGGWDAIVFADVLYLIAPEDRSRLLSDCIAALAPGGCLIVKEVNTEPRIKAFVAQFQEFLATNVLRITDGDVLNFPSATDIETLISSGGLTTRVGRLDKGYFHPHCVVVGTKAST